MNKKEAIQAMLDGKKVRHSSWQKGHLEYDGDKIVNARKVSWFLEDLANLDVWELYEEPAKEEAPEHVDIEVTMGSDGLRCREWFLSDVIAKFIERHDTRYFATWYIIDTYENSEPHTRIKHGPKSTFASHVRFVREDLLGGIPK